MENLDSSRKAGGPTRRDFIKKTAGAAATVAATGFVTVPVYGQNTAPSANVKGANDRIVVGHIGVGGQGMAHVREIKTNAGENNVAQAAVCDVSKYRVAKAQEHIGGKVDGYADHRKLLERKDIDAVVVATIDPWHTPCSIEAMQSGKDVYCEKPMTRYLDEAWQIHDTCKRTGKLIQVGSQGCTAAKYHKAAELIKGGAIGPLVLGQTSYMRNNPKGEWNYDIQKWCSADDVDWKRWLGPIKNQIPFSADHYFRWRKYYPYCGGLLGDLLPHLLHPFVLATGNPEFPSRVVSVGSRSWNTDKLTPGTPIRDVDESVQVLVEFPSGYSLMLASATVNEYGMTEMIRGHRGTLLMGGLGATKIELKPERKFADEVDAEEFPGLLPEEHIRHHEKNWFSCIRSRKQPNCGIDLAIRVQTVICLAEMSDRLNIMCLFDEKTRKITTGDGKEVKPITYGTLEIS